MGDVFLQGVRKYEYVVQVDEDVLVYDIPKNIINSGLEDSRCVSKAERHDQVLVVPPGRVECCLPFVSFFDPYQVVSVAKIKLGEILCSLKRGEGG